MNKQIMTILVLAAGLCRVAIAAPADQDFATKAALSGIKEIKLSQLAETKSSTMALKNFGKQMVADHTKAAAQLHAIAAKKSLKLPATNPEADQEFNKLNALSGAAFDREYAAVMLSDHQKAVALFGQESKSGQDQDFMGFAGKTLPTLKHHLMMAQSNQASVKSSK